MLCVTVYRHSPIKTDGSVDRCDYEGVEKEAICPRFTTEMREKVNVFQRFGGQELFRGNGATLSSPSNGSDFY
jgi:hypothetical protein